ncbi:hypothetical protein ABT300_34545 [Streptomyces sp. NPDC001027]|uniref:hypothetical protein n=1 Tax=Streptomyces sp. NPDC001027 TaxID=3154771 RepID=UPI0033222A5B
MTSRDTTATAPGGNSPPRGPRQGARPGDFHRARARGVVERLVASGQWKPGDAEVLIVLNAGYDAPRIARLLSDLLVEISASCAPTV